MPVSDSSVRHASVRWPFHRSFHRSFHSWACRAILISAALLPLSAVVNPVLGQTPAPAKAVLYENDPANPNGSAGTVVWRTEQAPPAPGKKPEIVVHADVDIPHKLTVHLTIQRNDDREMPASHLIRIQFTVPAGSPRQSVLAVPALLVKANETSSEAHLDGLAVKVADNFFLIGLTSAEVEKKRNVEWLLQRPLVIVPLVFADRSQAVVVIDEGAEGKRILAAALAAWGDTR